LKKQYFISGLGADETAFQKLADFGTTKIMVKWLKNLPDETLRSYAERLIKKYQIQQEDIIVGLSFGGLIAQQIAEILNSKFVILVSSFRTKDDLKLLINKGLNLKLHRLIPDFKPPIIDEIIASYLNSGSRLSKPVLKQMIEKTDVQLMKWSIEKIYQQEQPLSEAVMKYNLIGGKDKIVKTWRNESTYVIDSGSHFMVYDNAEEVSAVIKQIVTQDSV